MYSDQPKTLPRSWYKFLIPISTNWLTDGLTDWWTDGLTDWLIDWLTDLLMPSDKRNSIMAIATALISSLLNVASSQDVPFRQPQQLQCLHHGSNKTFLCSPFLSPLACRWRFAIHILWLRSETRVSEELPRELLMLFLAWNVAQHVRTAGSETKHSNTPWSNNTLTFKLVNEAHA